MLELTVGLLNALPKNGATDPIEFYRRPLVGYLFRERINMGLRLLGDRRFDRVLEVGFGAGAVLLAIAPAAGELFGIDLDADVAMARATLASRGVEADLQNGSVCDLPYDNGSFDLVVSCSVFEHLTDYRRALEEVRRILKTGGRFLLGMPAVNRTMDWGFRFIGFKGIKHHHVTTPSQVARHFAAAGLSIVSKTRLGIPKIPGAAVYYMWLLEALL